MNERDEIDFGTSDGPQPILTAKLGRKLMVWEQGSVIVLRLIAAFLLFGMFFAINFQVWRLISEAFASDAALIVSKAITGEQRVVTEKVLIALIAATAAEVGIGITAIVAYLFPRTASRYKAVKNLSDQA